MFWSLDSDTNRVGLRDEGVHTLFLQLRELDLDVSCNKEFSYMKDMGNSTTGQFLVYIFQIFL